MKADNWKHLEEMQNRGFHFLDYKHGEFNSNGNRPCSQIDIFMETIENKHIENNIQNSVNNISEHLEYN